MAPTQYDFSAPFEGIVPYLYYDSKGLVTCGVGFLLLNISDSLKLPWTPEGVAATDWAKLQTLPKGKYHTYYKPYMIGRLPEEFMRYEFARRLAGFEKRLRKYLPSFDTYPAPVQLALRDMIYNLGGDFLAKGWPNFKAALLAKDWKRAAQECNRIDVQDSRNAATKALFLSV